MPDLFPNTLPDPEAEVEGGLVQWYRFYNAAKAKALVSPAWIRQPGSVSLETKDD